MKYSSVNWLLFATFILLVQPCFSQQSSKIRDEYFFRYSKAMDSNNIETIQSSINYIAELILTNTAPVINAPYNKAQLEYKIGDNDKAISTLESWESNSRYIYLVTIFLKLGKIDEADTIINNILKELIDDINANSKTRKYELNNIVMYYRALNMDYSELINNWIRKGIITQDDVQNAERPENAITNQMLDSMWPRDFIFD
jgi:tetratricopeptide (TPR) repeat protein